MPTVTPESAEAPRPPFHLRDNSAPVTDEVMATDLPVVGTLPEELAGRCLRNGPDPRHGESAHWFLGDGMLHGIRIRDGRAEWYRDRWVRTRALDEPDARMIAHDFGPARIPGEEVLVPREGATGEDDGYPLMFVCDKTTNTAEFVVLEAGDMAAAPVARGLLPQRVPFGFHGSWIPDPE